MALPEMRMKALQLRRSGSSLSEISRALEVSKSSVSLWVRHTPLSREAAQEIARKRADARARAAATKRARVDQKLEDALHYGRNIVSRAAKDADSMRLLCALLYWCEGTKMRRREVMSFTNSDPNLVSAFLRLLRTQFEIYEERFRLSVHIHEYHEAEEQLRFWSKVTNIPLAQCHKPYRKPHTAKRKREGYQGCVSVRYLDVDFGRRLEGIAKAYLMGL